MHRQCFSDPTPPQAQTYGLKAGLDFLKGIIALWKAEVYKPKLNNRQLAQNPTPNPPELGQQLCGQTTKRGVSAVSAGKGMGNYRAAPQLKGIRIIQLTGSLLLSIYSNNNFHCPEF